VSFPAGWMAAHTGGAIPRVTRDTFVVVVCFQLPVLVAVGAGNDAIVRRHLMTFDAAEYLVWPGGDVECVIELGALPSVGVMARLAALWELRCDVIRICRGVVIGQMALNAIRSDALVVKHGPLPRVGVMARLAILWELRCDVIRICRGIVIGQMALNAIRSDSLVVKDGPFPRHGIVA
jgi:hypothetical protein